MRRPIEAIGTGVYDLNEVVSLAEHDLVIELIDVCQIWLQHLHP